jgi:4-hydroxy-tetrahydrodipicolinate synthase
MTPADRLQDRGESGPGPAATGSVTVRIGPEPEAAPPGPEFRGVFAATVTPLKPNFAVDEEVLARHVQAVASTRGIAGLLVNGHAGENFTLDRGEKRAVLAVVRATVGPRCQLIAGVNSESSLEAAAQAMDAQAAGADAILVFPPFSWVPSRHRDSVLVHHRYVIEAVDLPIMLYAAAVGCGGMVYEPDLLADLVRLPRVVGIKEGSWETARYEANRRLVRGINPAVAVMASGDEHLLPCFLVGTEGSQVSLASLVPEVVVTLYEAVEQRDLARARAAHEVIYPLARAIYGTAPASHATARLKACLGMLGRLEHDVVRPPIGPLDRAERERLRQALREAKLL